MHKRLHARILAPWLIIGMLNPSALSADPHDEVPPIYEEPGEDFPWPSVPAPTGSSTISYKAVDATTVALTFHDTDAEAAKIDPKVKLSVDRLLEKYEEHRLIEQKTHEDISNSGQGATAGSMIAGDLADDERLYSDMKAERIFYDELLFFSKGFGIGAVGWAASYVAKLLSENQGMPHTRIAFVLASLSAVAANGYVKILEDRKKTLDAAIADLERAMQQRENYLSWIMEYGGDTTVPFQPPTCLYKTSCVDTEVCVRQGLIGEENCRKQTVCGSELLQCRN